MPGNPRVAELRDALSLAGWKLTELAGGPWIIYGYHGETPLCVMGKTRIEAWEKARDAAKALGLLASSGRGNL